MVCDKMIIEKHKGIVPDNFLDLESFPSVGHKTASVVISQGLACLPFQLTHIFID